MSENKEAEVKLGLFKHILLVALKSPINTILFLAFSYFGLKAYVFGDALIDKLIMFGILALWMFWFIAKHMLMILLLILLLGGGAYFYYEYTHQQEKECEANGGEWNRDTKVCEERQGFWDYIENLWIQYEAKDQR